MRILEVIYSLSCGGAEHFVVDLSNELAKGNDVFLMTLTNDKEEMVKRNFYRAELSDKVHYVNLGLSVGYQFGSLLKIAKAIKSIKPDVVHVHLSTILHRCFLSIILLSRKIPFFQTIHGNIYPAYSSGLNKIMYKTYGKLRRLKIACLSPKNYNDFRSLYPNVVSTCIVNGRSPMLPTELFDAVTDEISSYKKNESSLIYIHVARYHPIKDQNLLIDSFNDFVSMGFNAELLIVGAYFDSGEGLKLQSKSCDRIHFVGSRHNIPDYMLNSNVFCLSSLSEGMPITLIEASLCGVPAVSTPVCGAVDMISNGVNGYLCSDHTKAEYTKALIESYNNYKTIRQNAEEMKENNPYTIKECAGKYLEFFKQSLIES